MNKLEEFVDEGMAFIVQCSDCMDEEIEMNNNCHDKKRFLERLKERGWEYVKAWGDIMCPECAKEYKEQSNAKEKSK